MVFKMKKDCACRSSPKGKAPFFIFIFIIIFTLFLPAQTPFFKTHELTEPYQKARPEIFA